MDEQRIQDRVFEAAEKVGETIGTMAGDSTKQAGAAVQAKLDQGKAMIRDAQASAATLARQASEAGNKRWLKPGSWCKVPHAKPATRRRERRQTSISRAPEPAISSPNTRWSNRSLLCSSPAQLVTGSPI